MKISRSYALLVSSLLVVSTITGCAAPTPPQAEREDPVSVMIQASIARSNLAPTFTESSLAKPATPILAGAQISLTFAGDARTLLPKIAAANNLQFAALGPQPHLPLFITVNVHNVPLTALLKEVAAQFGQRASLALTDKAIEIRYNGMVGQR